LSCVDRSHDINDGRGRIFHSPAAFCTFQAYSNRHSPDGDEFWIGERHQGADVSNQPPVPYS